MNKTENIFHNLPKKNFYIIEELTKEKKEKKREKSFVLEIKELNREIDEEIKREIQEGKIDVFSSSNRRGLIN